MVPFCTTVSKPFSECNVKCKLARLRQQKNTSGIKACKFENQELTKIASTQCVGALVFSTLVVPPCRHLVSHSQLLSNYMQYMNLNIACKHRTQLISSSATTINMYKYNKTEPHAHAVSVQCNVVFESMETTAAGCFLVLIMLLLGSYIYYWLEQKIIYCQNHTWRKGIGYNTYFGRCFDFSTMQIATSLIELA